MIRAWLLVGVGVVLLSGCPRSREDGGGGGPIPIDDLFDETVAAYCDFLFSCHVGDDDTSGLRVILRDQPTCREYLARLVDASSQLRALEAAVAAGTITYDADAAGNCLGAIRAGCSATVSETGFTDDATCDDAFRGTVAEGGSCRLDEECVDGLACDFGPGTCPGACAPDPFATADCGDATCADGQECFFPDGGTERCVTEVLEPDAAAGQPCGLVEEDTATVTRRACAEGLWCTGDSDTIGTCRAPIAAGAPCGGSNEVCVADHVCVAGSCQLVTVVTEPGTPCAEEMLRLCDPLLRLECQDGACVEVTDGRSGSPCRGGDFGEWTCNEGLVCHRDTMTCGTPKPSGATCSSDQECESGSCDFTAMSCRAEYCEA